MVKQKNYTLPQLSLSFQFKCRGRELQSTHPAHSAALNKSDLLWKGTPVTGMGNRQVSSQNSSTENILLNHTQLRAFFNRSFWKYAMWIWTGAKTICTHNSLYHHLHFKNCSDTFCKSNRLLEVPHATQLLLIILWRANFTHQENTLRNTCSVFSSSLLGVCMLLAHEVCPNDCEKFLKIRPSHTKS